MSELMEPPASLTQAKDPAKDARAAKRNGRTAWFLLLALVATLFYYAMYRPQRAMSTLDQADPLGAPSFWQGGKVVPDDGPFLMGFYQSSYEPDVDPADTLMDWIDQVELSDITVKDADELREKCLGGVTCQTNFEYGKYYGRLTIFMLRPTSAGPRYGIQYVMWQYGPDRI